MKRPDEYFAYDPRPVMLRNRDVSGGLGKRSMSVGTFFSHYIDYVHRIIGRYYPLRVLFLYPLYLLVAYFMSVGSIWKHSRRYVTLVARIWAAVALAVGLPVLLTAAVFRVFQPSHAL